METIKFFEEVESLKAEFNALKETKNCFLNTKTNQIIPVEQAGGKDLSDFNFQPELPNETIDSIMQNKIQELFENTKENKSDEVSEFLKNNPDWYLEKPMMFGFYSYYKGKNAIKVVDISKNYKTKKIKVTFKITKSEEYPQTVGGLLIYEVTLSNYYIQSVNFEKGVTYYPSSVSFGVPEFYTKEINGVTLYKFKQVRSTHYRASGSNNRR